MNYAASNIATYRYDNQTLTAGYFRNGVYANTRTVPIPVLSDYTPTETLIFACLLDWMDDARQARVLARITAALFHKKLSRESWAIPQDELEAAVIIALVRVAEAIHGRSTVELLGGQRRDKLRSLAATVETGAAALV